MSVTWGLLVGQYRSVGGGPIWLTSVLDHVEGTREEAMRALYEHAVRFRPDHPMGPIGRTLVYQEDDAFVQVAEGVNKTWHCRFTVAPLLYNSAVQQG